MSLERIEVTPFAIVAGEILQHRRTGLLTVLAPTVRKSLYWVQGDLVMSVSPEPADSLAALLVKKGAIDLERQREVFGEEPHDAVARLHEAGLYDLSSRQNLLREWLLEQIVPLFSLEEGTTAFSDEEALPPEKRIFLPSTAALLVEGVRAITNGLVLRRSLGDMKREIEPARDSRFAIDVLPLTEAERRIASSLMEARTVETFLREHAAQSSLAARVAVMLTSLGVWAPVRQRASAAPDEAQMQRDLELLATIGAADQRSLRAIALARQLSTLDHYQVLEVPRAAARTQITIAGESLKRKYEPSTYPAAMRETLETIRRGIDEAVEMLLEPGRRAAYDRLLQGEAGESASFQQRAARHNLAVQNYLKAKELATQGDFYGAIVLLKQTVNFEPDHADAWRLLGICQEKNPRWRREAAESLQRALSINPADVEAMMALGDLYRHEGMTGRAQTCFDDVLKVDPEHQQARLRLQGLKKR